LRQKLAEIALWNETCPLNRTLEGDHSLGIIASGVTSMHVREAAPEAALLKLGVTYPLPLDEIRRFAQSVERCLVIEENDPYLFEQIRAAGVNVAQKPEMYRFGELNVGRVRRILGGDTSPETAPPPGKAPSLCAGCPHRLAFDVLKKLDCIVAGDIGCYTLAALPPVAAMDSQLCMGASIGMGLGLRHALPDAEARRVVSVIGDSTFVHSGIPGLVEMVYNPPATGHVVLILDNGTTAMTGLQEHPGTGLTLGREPTGRLVFEDLIRSLGVENVVTLDPVAEPGRLEHIVREALGHDALTVIVVRRHCLLAAAREVRETKGKASGGENGSRAARPQPVNGEPRGPALDIPSLGAHFRSPGGRSAPQNVVIAGLGGQGVLTASDILADAAVLAGFDVKKAEVHGMSQRGGSVSSDVRFGAHVLSPMVPPGEADFLLVLADDQVDNNRHRLRPGGVLITPEEIRSLPLPNRRAANVALLGVLSRRLEIDDMAWRKAICKHVKSELVEVNQEAFELGRQTASA
jgi:Pyruvate/2-oxoacid:ferredoxin oxidoreductase gamma subunit